MKKMKIVKYQKFGINYSRAGEAVSLKVFSYALVYARLGSVSRAWVFGFKAYEKVAEVQKVLGIVIK